VGVDHGRSHVAMAQQFWRIGQHGNSPISI
jgi:hypothetical protein